MSDAIHRAAVTERAARAGGVVAQERFRGALTVETKSSATDVVTQSDRDAQQQVLATIAQEFPDATVVCEEEAGPVGAADLDIVDSVPESGDCWVVDPIDGTANYVREIGFWGTSVAAVSGGDPVTAATYMPAMGDIYTAGPESVSRHDEPMAVSERADPAAGAVGLLGRWSAWDPAVYTTLVEEATGRFGDVRRFGCMQGVLALVAAGGLEGAIMLAPPFPWDSLAGTHLVRRAGGRVTDLDGERFTDGDRTLVASSDTDHDLLLEVAREAADAGAV
jgi:myo-inositol-1(or 4)-monophosphatase